VYPVHPVVLFLTACISDKKVSILINQKLLFFITFPALIPYKSYHRNIDLQMPPSLKFACRPDSFTRQDFPFQKLNVATFIYFIDNLIDTINTSSLSYQINSIVKLISKFQKLTISQLLAYVY